MGLPKILMTTHSDLSRTSLLKTEKPKSHRSKPDDQNYGTILSEARKRIETDKLNAKLVINSLRFKMNNQKKESLTLSRRNSVVEDRFKTL